MHGVHFCTQSTVYTSPGGVHTCVKCIYCCTLYRYSLVVRSNPNLRSLFPRSALAGNLTLERGAVYVMDNEQLCQYKISELLAKIYRPPASNGSRQRERDDGEGKRKWKDGDWKTSNGLSASRTLRVRKTLWLIRSIMAITYTNETVAIITRISHSAFLREITMRTINHWLAHTNR